MVSPRDQAVQSFEVSPRYISGAKKLKEEQPDLLAAIQTGERTITEAKAGIERAKRAAVVERIANDPVPFPTGPFRVIVIDPPWKYQSRADDIAHRARNPYPDMEQDAVKAQPVLALAHGDW